MKWLAEIQQKVVSGVLIALICGMGLSLWSYGGMIVDLPETLKKLEWYEKQDSIRHVKQLKKDSLQDEFIKQDWRILNDWSDQLGLPEPKTY